MKNWSENMYYYKNCVEHSSKINQQNQRHPHQHPIHSSGKHNDPQSCISQRCNESAERFEDHNWEQRQQHNQQHKFHEKQTYRNFSFSKLFCRCHLCDYIAMKKTKTTTESGFYKFLARFSGRRRSLYGRFHSITSLLISILIVISLFRAAESCSSRTTPKPRPPPTPSPRPNITFHTYTCPPTYAAWYCLNQATCFTVKIGDEILYNCECADGYMGPRCEYKDLDGSYLPTRPRVMLETASIASGATLAFIFVLILCLILYVRWHQRQKLERLATNGGVDTVDGLMHVVKRGPRPFGPHHYYTIPMASSLKR